MLERVKAEVIQRLAQIRIRSEAEVAELEEQQRRDQERRALEFQHAEAATMPQQALEQSGDGRPTVGETAPLVQEPVMRDQPKIGRNDPCPCGSGKKYKQCHGKLA